MNRKQLQQQVGQTRRLRPIPKSSGREVDDLWKVAAADDANIELHNLRTGHVLTLGYDHVHEFRTPDFLVLKSNVTLDGNRVSVEPIVAAPKVTLDVVQPLPVATQGPDGLWTQEIHVRPSRVEAVPGATVAVLFKERYQSARYQVVPEDPPTMGLCLQELFGVEGSENSDMFRMGLAELPRGTWLRLSFRAARPPQPREIRLDPYVKYS